jgi:Na+-driven multidrug efflux pump
MIFLLPLLIILPPIMGVNGVWASLPASDTVAFIVTWIIMIRYMRQFKLQHKALTNGQ